MAGWFSNSNNNPNNSNYDENESYTKTQDYSGTRPRSRDDTDEEYNSRVSAFDRSASRDKDGGSSHVSGPTSWNVTQKGVPTNALGVPQYDYAERSATSARDDKDGDGYSDFYTENPSSTISPQQAQVQDLAGKAAGFLMGPIGLGIKTITKLQKAGIIPGGVDANAVAAQTGGGNSVSRADRDINRVLKNPKLSDEQKKAKVNDIIKAAAAAEGVEDVQAMADAAFGGIDPKAVANRPKSFMGNAMMSATNVRGVNPNAPGAIMSDVQAPTGSLGYDPTTVQAWTAGGVEAKEAQGYDAVTTADQIAENGQATAQQGQVSQDSLVDAEQIDEQAAADGTSSLGKAINDYASQGMSQIIDTSTMAGKLLAQELGEGNYIDSKATMAGQMEILSKQFVGPNGEPVIPSWAAGTARNVSRIAAFKGMTGTAATAAMSQAIMEASLPMAQQDAQFFQTTTLKNLDNRQQMTINKANVLARLAEVNLDARMTAAVTNANAFLQTDLKNLDNRQQTEIVNTQARVQAILEDAKSENAARLYSAQAANDFTKFYDELGTQIEQFNVSQRNAMEQWNAGEINDAREFQINMDEQRDQFYANMQYNVDLANARWRQTVETESTRAYNEAARTDAQNLVNITTEALNQLWDREDAILDYAWKAGENAAQRKVQIYQADKGYELQKRQIKNEEDAALGQAIFEGSKLLFGDWSGDGGLLGGLF